MHLSDQEHISFVADLGLYCYKMMLFGLNNAGATYQRLVNRMFASYIEKTMEVYVDGRYAYKVATLHQLCQRP